MTKFHKCFGDCEGPLGFPMKSEVARAVEQILKGLDGDCKSFLAKEPGGIARRGKIPAKVELKPGERADISLVTTDTIDLDREVVKPEGGDWSYFAKNGGRVPWAHNYSLPDVGRCLWMTRTAAGESPNGWRAKTVYHPRPGEDVIPKDAVWFPDVVNHYVQELGLKGKSIGFVPTAMGKPTSDEVKARPELAEASWMIREWIGLEYSVAPIQCNPDAVAEMVSKARRSGLETPDAMLKSFGVVVPGFGGDEPARPAPEREIEVVTVPEVRALVAAAMKSVDIAAIVRDAVAGRRGRV